MPPPPPPLHQQSNSPDEKQDSQSSAPAGTDSAAASPPENDDDDNQKDDRNGVPGSSKQIGKKFGEHMDPDTPGYRNIQEYRDLMDKIYNSPDTKRTVFPSDAQMYPGETHLMDDEGNLLRLDPEGNFRSMYPVQ